MLTVSTYAGHEHSTRPTVWTYLMQDEWKLWYL